MLGGLPVAYPGARPRRQRCVGNPRAKVIKDVDAAQLLQNSPDRDTLTAGARFFRHDSGRSAAVGHENLIRRIREARR